MTDVDDTALTGAEVVPVENAEVTPAVEQATGSEATTEQVETPQTEQLRDEKGRYVPQERLNEVTKARRTAERERDTERAEKERLRQELEQFRAQKPSAPPESYPTLDQFGYDAEKYQQALSEYHRKQAVQEIQTQFKDQERQRNQRESVQKYEAKAKEFAADKPDFDDRVRELGSVVQYPPEIIEAFASSDYGPAVVYHLATHLDEADRIARLPPHLAAVQIGRIEAQVSAPKPKPVTSAPKPAPTLSGGSVANRGIREGMSYEEYKAARSKG